MGQQEQTTSVPQFSKKDCQQQQQQQQQNGFENSKPYEALITTFHLLSNHPSNLQKKNIPQSPAKVGCCAPPTRDRGTSPPGPAIPACFSWHRIHPKNLGRKPSGMLCQKASLKIFCSPPKKKHQKLPFFLLRIAGFLLGFRGFSS